MTSERIIHHHTRGNLAVKDGHIYATRSVTASEREYIRDHKNEIIATIEAYERELSERVAAECDARAEEIARSVSLSAQVNALERAMYAANSDY